MADAQSLLQWGKKADRQQARMRKRSPVDRALDPLVAQLKRARSVAEMPLEVMFHLPIKPTAYAMYAWYSEAQLAIALNVAYGRHAAATSLLYSARFPMVPGDAPMQADNVCWVKESSSSSSSALAVDRLDVLAARTLTEDSTWIEWTALPEYLLNTLGFEVWRAITLARHDGHWADDDPSALPRRDDVDYFKGLIALAEAWGIDPTQSQRHHPVLLCGALAREAIKRRVHRAEALLCDPSERLGGARLTRREREAWKAVCESPASRRFARVPGRIRKPRDVADVCRKIYVKVMGVPNNDRDEAMIKSLNELFLKVNTQHDKRKNVPKLSKAALREKFGSLLRAINQPDPEEKAAAMESLNTFLNGEGKALVGDDDGDDDDDVEDCVQDEDDGSGCPPLPAETQAILAMFALRSGIQINPDDLANAGRACAAFTPAIALTT